MPCRGKLVIFVQFGSKLQHLISHDKYSKYFLRHCSIMGHMVVVANFAKKSLFQAKGEFGSNLAENYLTLYLMISHRVFFKHFGMMGKDSLTKVASVSFSQKSSFYTIVHFWPILGRNYATLCPKQLCLMIHSLKILKSSIMGCNG